MKEQIGALAFALGLIAAVVAIPDAETQRIALVGGYGLAGFIALLRLLPALIRSLRRPQDAVRGYEDGYVVGFRDGATDAMRQIPGLIEEGIKAVQGRLSGDGD